MPAIKRIVFFGDSLSDIGNMQGRTLIGGLSGVNAHGRFSDGKNWVDFFWEGVGGKPMFDRLSPTTSIKKSKKHRSMTESIAFKGKALQMVNYAEGGAIGLHESDGVPWGKVSTYKALASLNQQVDRYLEQCTPETTAVDGSNTLHVVWIGANDIVTIDRSYDVMPTLAANIKNQIARIFNKVWKSHVLVIDLPTLADMPRFKPLESGELMRIERCNEAFNIYLKSQTARLAKQTNWRMGSVRHFEISEVMTESVLGRWGFAPFAKPWSCPVGVGIGADLEELIPFAKFPDIALDESSEFATTEDQLHPTEGVYRKIAQLVLNDLDGAGFTFG